jgi:hypothetical protein
MKKTALLAPLLTAIVLGACVQVTGETECLEGDCEDGGRRSSDARSARGDGNVEDEPDTIILPDGREVPVDPEIITTSSCDERECAAVIAAGEVPRDTDGDGFVDCEEGLLDVDGDGLANCEDPDSDGDGINDRDEGTGDTDGDGISDAYDDDADGDGIADRYEGTDDPDEDGIPNYLDLDSDGDLTPDIAEYGRDPSNPGPPVDRDGDGIPDFLDLDSDGDGLADIDEASGCPTTSQRDQPDSDGDNYSDLVELAFGSDPCNPGSDIRTLVDFYFELPFNGPEESDTLQFGSNINRGDVLFQMDTTGSMGGEISRLKSSLGGTIIPGLSASLPDVATGVSRFDDFPCNGFGSSGDVPFQLLQRITTDASAAQAGVNRLDRHSGGDGPESGFAALYQAASGEGWTGGCTNIPAFDPAVGNVPGVADGTIGGAGFRAGSVPIVVHITDAVSHARGEGGYNYGSTRDETYNALSAIGGRVIGVASGNAARSDLEGISNRSGTRVPPCAWDAGRPSGCGVGQCCTGRNGAGRAPDGDGNCTLVFDIADDGGGLDTSIISGVDALINFAPITVTTRVRRDEDEYLPEGRMVDTNEFIVSIIPIGGEAPASTTCAALAAPTPADLDGDGVNESFINVTPGSSLFFEVRAQNDFYPGEATPQVFRTFIDVLGNGVAVLDTRDVSILVPPNLKQ